MANQPGEETKRETMGDPRPSIEECYESREAYRGHDAEAAMALVEQRYRSPEDVPSVIAFASALWQHVQDGLE